MGMDYYGILKVSATANEEELRRAYKKLAMRWHPDKHPSGAKGLAEAKFKQICEAYDVLSDSQKRQIYDLYGEDGLKYNVSSPSAATHPPRGGSKATSFKYPNSDDMFEEFFNDMGGDNTENLKKQSNLKKENENFRKYSRSGSTEKKAAPVENKLLCSLEDLYKGSKRKMKISRIVSDLSGKPTTVEEVLAIDIRPGWKKGTKITFPEKGNQEAGLLPGDLIFVIDEKPHATFKRDGNDLVLNQKVSLVEALTGKMLNISTLDGRNLNIEVSDIVKPGHEVLIPGEGMPISKEPKKRGNMRIKFDVKFPSRLSVDQKSDLRRVLGTS
ncbi:DnaJ-like protein subfamily B member 1 [Bienertia sinuspersici]